METPTSSRRTQPNNVELAMHTIEQILGFTSFGAHPTEHASSCNETKSEAPSINDITLESLLMKETRVDDKLTPEMSTLGRLLSQRIFCAKSTDEPEQARSYACTDCDYQIGRKQTGDKPYACDECQYRTAHKKLLQLHMFSHTGEKPFACKECDYRTVHKGHLNQHVKIHANKKQYACGECEFQTVDRQRYRRHQMIHSGEKPHRCRMCEYRTIHKQSLKEHMNCHTGDKPFTCRGCDYRAVNRGTLRRHRIKIHTGEAPSPALNTTHVDQC